jgi:hypothetical protein
VGDGDPVGNWICQVTAADNITQGTAADKPIYRASVATFNNQPALQFDGTDWLRGAWSATLSQPNTYFVVCKFDSGGATTFMYDGDDASNRHALYVVSGVWRLFAGADFITGVSVNANVNIYMAIYNGASSQLAINGTESGTGNPGTQTPDGFTVGADRAGSSDMTGYYGEVLVFDANLTTADKNRVQNYLAAKYGISVTAFT